VDPRFNRTAAVADSFTQILARSDIAFLAGLMNYALAHDRYQAEYVRLYTNATFLVKDGYAFNEQEGVFSGWDAQKNTYDKSTWIYELDERGFAKVDPQMEHPRSVLQFMKKFYARYTPEMVSQVCGCKPANADETELTDDDILIRYEKGEVVGVTVLHARACPLSFSGI
jgi:formate dehydrogenase major subunit